MKATLYSVEGKKLKTIELPEQFDEEFRPDLIQRAFHAYQANTRQDYGAYPRAGIRQSAVLSRRRRKFKTSYGHGISRVPRKSLWRRGRQFGWVGAFAPNTVGGRRSHPPKAKKILGQKINVKERRRAIRSALAASVQPDVVKMRGHQFTELPSVVETTMEGLKKTKDVFQLLEKLQLHQELVRAAIKKVRAGKGKNRGRTYVKKKGPLFVVSSPCALLNAAANIPGVDACTFTNLNINLLAPGGMPGRLTIFSEKAIEQMKATKAFTLTPTFQPAVKHEKKHDKNVVQLIKKTSGKGKQ